MGQVRRPGVVCNSPGGIRPLNGEGSSLTAPAGPPIESGPDRPGHPDPYRSFAGWYDRIFEPMNRGLRLLGLRMFAPRPGMAVLDVGCGTGAQLGFYQRFDCQLSGVDSSPSMLGIAKARLGEAADLRLGNAVALPYPAGHFDLVISMLCLHEMKPELRPPAVEEMKRVLKENGRVLLIDHHPGPIHPIQGWVTKAVVLVAEAAAGREHFRNYRQFMASKGLPTLAATCGLKAARTRIVGGGALALMLLKTAS